ncbi:MAG: tryptophan synthase subunit alpha [Gammaproteobacteria bacterium]|nr:tryptophan synthase subunit alpha [Gammaproteobacteria bacterium]
MRRYAMMFEKLCAEGRGAFIPFTVLGFPDEEQCFEHLKLLARHTDALELGMAFSDPVADGPTIQRAITAALAAGATPARCLRLVARLRERCPDLPIGLLVYANLVVHPGIERFYGDAAAAGADSVLVADVPSEEGEAFSEAARAAGIAPVFIAPPNADDCAFDRIARLGAGYTYVLARSGVTGAEPAACAPAEGLFNALAVRKAPPPVAGFGISTPEQVRAALAAGAAGAVCGSAVVERLGALGPGETRHEAVTAWLDTMRDATRAIRGEFSHRPSSRRASPSIP